MGFILPTCLPIVVIQYMYTQNFQYTVSLKKQWSVKMFKISMAMFLNIRYRNLLYQTRSPDYVFRVQRSISSFNKCDLAR